MLRSDGYGDDTALYISVGKSGLERVGTRTKMPSRCVGIRHFLKGFAIHVPDNLWNNGGNADSERDALQLPWSIWVKPKDAPINRLLNGNAGVWRFRCGGRWGTVAVHPSPRCELWR